MVAADLKISAADTECIKELLYGDIIDTQFYHYFMEDGRRKLFTGAVLREMANDKVKIKYVRDEDHVVTIEKYSRIELCVDLICGDLIVIA